MLFQSKEKDRFGAFCSDGSIRSNLDWERFCDFDVTLPSVKEQQKYVNVYLAIQNNLNSFQEKAEELLNNLCPVLVKGSLQSDI